MNAPHAAEIDAVLSALTTSEQGLSQTEAAARLQRYGANSLPRARPPGVVRVFIAQFASPLIYVLAAAALVSLVIEEFSDAVFITAVLLVNAIIGTVQEYSAQRAADALNQLLTTQTRALRDGATRVIDAETLVPGDIILLESGDKVPADARLLSGHALKLDESLLTGESTTVTKHADARLSLACPLGDRVNMAFAGTMVSSGRQKAVVVQTGAETELGMIAATVLGKRPTKAPLLVRMERFTHRVAIGVLVAASMMGAVALTRGMPIDEVFLLAVAVAVSAIPEGLPVALTVALAIGVQRMAKRNVIVRRLVAVEALGSCTFIATDKTGTLTENRLAARRIAPPGAEYWEVGGEAGEPIGMIVGNDGSLDQVHQQVLSDLCRCAVLANEGALDRDADGWTLQGDAVDTALLVMAGKAGVTRPASLAQCPEVVAIPFESERQFSASLNRVGGETVAFVKGAAERLLAFCQSMQVLNAATELDSSAVLAQADDLAGQGYRVIALAAGKVDLPVGAVFSETQLRSLTFLGLVGIMDPLRPEARPAVAACREAGIMVAMVTGDHPTTATTIATELDLIDGPEQILTGPELRSIEHRPDANQRVERSRVFARMEPQQKLDIVNALKGAGHFVAVSGDGANDAPALRAAQVGVAMGQSGTDVARETADIIITDDNFASIVNGVEEGRIAYANVRKVIFLLISTGAAELVLITLALIANLPLPLLAVQLLWLNLVTNGIQDVALAFEPGEGDELSQRPRPPSESIFNRLMIERVILSALVMGIVAFTLFWSLIEAGLPVDEARNSTLLLMVLFENAHVFNSRSEKRSAFRQTLTSNRILVIGTIAAQLIHIGAMYTPWISDVLHIEPVSLEHWGTLLFMACSVLIAMELHKAIRRRFPIGSRLM